MHKFETTQHSQAKVEISSNRGPNSFVIKYAILWLSLATMLLYLPSVFSGITRLDDYVFLVRFQHYNSHFSNLFTSFSRGVFGFDDNYYRPVFMDTMLLNSWLFGGKVMGYHIVNILLHTIAVALLYSLFLKLRLAQLHAFILAGIFAIHPVLVQAVSWIPGRNDTLLAVFAFSFFISYINYLGSGRLKHLILAALSLLLSLFTKENGIIVIPAALILSVGVLQYKLVSKQQITQYVIWGTCGVLWLLMRYHAHINNHISTLTIIKELPYKAPLILQYIGKVLLPVNLSVLPSMRDTTNVWGIISVILLVSALLLNKHKNWRMILCGLALFFLFVLPTLFVPHYMTSQTFEHRLYLPLTGLLLLMPQTLFFSNKLSGKQLLTCFGIVAVFFATINFRHQQYFANPIAFWSQAVKSSPTSAVAHMMLAMQVTDKEQAHELFRKTRQLNPRIQHLNYNMAITLQKEDSVLASEKYLLAEQEISGYYMCYFYLARVAAFKGDFQLAEKYYKVFIQRDRNNTPTDKALVLNNPVWQQQDSARVFLLNRLHE